MNCPQKLVTLPCGKSGIGFLAQPLSCAQTTLRLMDGHQANFPELTSGQHFYVVITKPCNTCCSVFRITGISDNILSINGIEDCPCGCFPSNSKVEYTTDVREYIQDIAMEIGFNVISPLKWDCTTRTLSLDCNELLNKPDCGCN